jgi:hypothetical protein
MYTVKRLSRSKDEAGTAKSLQTLRFRFLKNLFTSVKHLC